jgi:hypothetical protein
MATVQHKYNLLSPKATAFYRLTATEVLKVNKQATSALASPHDLNTSWDATLARYNLTQ